MRTRLPFELHPMPAEGMHLTFVPQPPSTKVDHTITLADGLRVRSAGVTKLGSGGHLINLSDIEDDDGMTTKERNLQIGHNVELGALVELSSGVRVFVVFQGRDCDKTPLYWLSVCPRPLFFNNAIYDERGITRDCMRGKLEGGYPEDALTVIAGPERAYAELIELGYHDGDKWLESPYYGYEVTA